MDNIFCTLFDSNYLDKGLVLYDSMKKCMDDFKLYVFAFDDKCKEILEKEKLDNLIVIGLDEFETEEMLRVKKDRTRAEYCWTCSSLSIKHVIENYNEQICTYIDADMMFFSSPDSIFKDMRKNNCSVIIVPHRFKTEAERKKAHDEVGEYCVEFNTFVNDQNGMKALNWWADKCLEWCYYAVPGTTEWYGDQKYLNVFPEKFDGVYVCEHYGVGLAPWNVSLVTESDSTDTSIPEIKVKYSGDVFPIVIYHFENVAFLSKHILHASSGIKSPKLHSEIYDAYIHAIIDKRKYIEDKYCIKLSKARRVLTKNILMKIYQKYIMPIRRVKRIKDLYWVK